MTNEHNELPIYIYFMGVIADGWFWYREAPGENWEIIHKRGGSFYFNGRDAGRDIQSVANVPKFTLVRVESPPGELPPHTDQGST